MKNIRSVTIRMYEDEYRRLEQNAIADFRNPRQQARMLVLRGLTNQEQKNSVVSSDNRQTATIHNAIAPINRK